MKSIRKTGVYPIQMATKADIKSWKTGHHYKLQPQQPSKLGQVGHHYKIMS
jgi:hypothetical protein